MNLIKLIIYPIIVFIGLIIRKHNIIGSFGVAIATFYSPEIIALPFSKFTIKRLFYGKNKN